MKRGSEDRVREAVEAMDLETMLYKPPDDARNRKPADYLLWWADYERSQQGNCFVEVKDTPRVARWSLTDLRPSQRLAIRRAHELGVPYWLLIYWRTSSRWSISDAWRVLDSGEPSLTFSQLRSTYGIEANPDMLASTFRMVLLGEVM